MAWDTSNRRSRLPKNWSTIRTRILKRDPTCRWPGCTAPSTDCDHVVPNDDHRDANLQGLCHPHHVEKTTAERPARPTNKRAPVPHPGLVGRPK